MSKRSLTLEQINLLVNKREGERFMSITGKKGYKYSYKSPIMNMGAIGTKRAIRTLEANNFLTVNIIDYLDIGKRFDMAKLDSQFLLRMKLETATVFMTKKIINSKDLSFFAVRHSPIAHRNISGMGPRRRRIITLHNILSLNLRQIELNNL